MVVQYRKMQPQFEDVKLPSQYSNPKDEESREYAESGAANRQADD